MKRRNVLRIVELAAIKEVLEEFRGNKTRAAEVLGISLRALRMKVWDNEELAAFRGTAYAKGAANAQTRYEVGTLEEETDPGV